MLVAVDRGVPREEVAKSFSVSVPTIKRCLKRRRESGDVEPKPIPGRPARKGAMLQRWLPQQLEAICPDTNTTGEFWSEVLITCMMDTSCGFVRGELEL